MRKFTRDEVAKHNSSNDVWIIVQSDVTGEWGVYDMTEYLPDHPGEDALLRNAGLDGTMGVYGDHHPAHVVDFLEDFRIGDLVEE